MVSRSAARVLATGPDGLTPVVYRLDLRNAKSFFLAQRFPIEDKDVIYVANAELNELQKFFTLMNTLTGPVISGIVVKNAVPIIRLNLVTGARIRRGQSVSASDRATGAVIALDLSRLLSRAGRATPTGIDRVEFAYAEHLIASGQRVRASRRSVRTAGWRCCRAGSPKTSSRAIGAAWRGGGRSARAGSAGAPDRAPCPPCAAGRQRAAACSACCATARAAPSICWSRTIISKSRRLIARLKARSQARFVCLIHDLIPIEFPEYAKPGQAGEPPPPDRDRGRACRRVDRQLGGDRRGAAAASRSRRPGAAGSGGAVRRRSAGRRGDRRPSIGRPYFVYVGTIEARKNHLLLLNLWRRLAANSATRAPLLVLVGQRGWETENVIDMLDRCPALRDTVIEHDALSDAAMVPLLHGARALLLPSFAEGFGLPVIEALQLGVPALCSDIAALRETGGDVPEFLDPLDGPGWRAAILDYAAPQSPRRAAQLARLAALAPAALGRIFRRCRSLHRGYRPRSGQPVPASGRCSVPLRLARRGSVAGISRPRWRATAARSVGSAATARFSSSRIATASRTCASLCSAVRKKRSRAARSGTAG